MANPTCDIGLIGLAVMGQNLVLNMNDHGYTVGVFNRTTSKVDEFLAAMRTDESERRHYERVPGRDVAAILADQREASLHGHLLHSVHLVRLAPGVIEVRLQPEAPRDFAARLAAPSRTTPTYKATSTSRSNGLPRKLPTPPTHRSSLSSRNNSASNSSPPKASPRPSSSTTLPTPPPTNEPWRAVAG